MTAALFILGAFWRRWLGSGFLSAPRWLKLALWCVFVLAGLRVWQDPLNALPGLILCPLFVFGHDWTRRRSLYVRYALPLVACSIVMATLWGPAWLLYGLTGPALCEGYMLAGWFSRAHHGFDWTPVTARTRGFIDGPFALAELWAGGVVLGGIASYNL